MRRGLGAGLFAELGWALRMLNLSELLDGVGRIEAWIQALGCIAEKFYDEFMLWDPILEYTMLFASSLISANESFL